MSCTEDMDVSDAEDETCDTPRLAAQRFVSSHLVVRKSVLLVIFMSVRNMVTQSPLATKRCLSELSSSALLDTTEKKMAKTLLALYNRGRKIYSVFAYRDPCVL